MKVIVVTPAGRKRYLEVLLKNLKRERNGFDEWHLWVNTNVQEDVEYCRSLAAENEWIKTIELTGINEVSSWNIHRFFKHAMDKDCVYVRLDDDIVFLERGFFGKLVEYRLANPHPFLVYANIVNNAVVSHIHQRNGLIKDKRFCGYYCKDPVGWESGNFAEVAHRSFIKDLTEGRAENWHRSFSRWECILYERVSINAISWMGSDMFAINGEIYRDEEEYLSVGLPQMIKRPNHIFGGALAAHFAFYTQREYMDGTNILSVYAELADKG